MTSTNDTSNTLPLLNGLINIHYKGINNCQIPIRVPLIGEYKLMIPKVLFQGLFYLGLASSMFYILKYNFKFSKWFIDLIRSRFNSKKYLNSVVRYSSLQQELRAYAVIYGTSNKAGMAFALYLASKGFNLILIDRDLQPLNEVESLINQKVKKFHPIIYKIVLTKFDQESLNRNLSQVKELPIKLFLNCKNSKRKAPGDQNENGQLINGRRSALQSSEDREALTREEVFFTGKENIEGYACLANIFMRQLQMFLGQSAVINIDNEEYFNENDMKEGQLFYQAALKFQDTFTTLLSRQIKDLKTINVKVNFKSLKDNDRKQLKLCDNSFSYLGIKDTIYIN